MGETDRIRILTQSMPGLPTGEWLRSRHLVFCFV
jgi:hypothetical protein